MKEKLAFFVLHALLINFLLTEVNCIKVIDNDSENITTSTILPESEIKSVENDNSSGSVTDVEARMIDDNDNKLLGITASAMPTPNIHKIPPTLPNANAKKIEVEEVAAKEKTEKSIKNIA